MKRRFSRWYSVLAVVAVLMLALTGCSAAQNVAKPMAVAPVASNGVPQEGIKVHGHWTFDVTNPDGTLAEHREFENALMAGSDLPRFLVRQYSVGGWMIELAPPTGEVSAFFNSFGDPVSAYIYESSSNENSLYTFKNLTLTLAQGGVVLSGTATGQRAGMIGAVKTWTAKLPPTSPPSSQYLSGQSSPLTSATLATPVSVSAGQQIAVTVVISFS